jgi:hypothetical protein
VSELETRKLVLAEKREQMGKRPGLFDGKSGMVRQLGRN